MLEIAGQKKGLLLLAGLLSVGSAMCMLVPDWAVYEVLKEYIMALTPGNCAQDLTMAAYRNVRRPMEPLDIVGDERRIAETYEVIDD